jgi:putative transposase
MNGALARYCTLQVYRLHIAIIHRNPPAGIMFHADRGAQYTSTEFRDFCRANGVRPSVGRTGICYDHPVAESFFATLKKELIHTRPSDY